MESVAQAVVFSLWQDVQAFGIWYLSVLAGVTMREVCALTKVPGTPSLSIPRIVHHVPLCGQRVGLIIHPGKVMLLPLAAIDKGDSLLRKSGNEANYRHPDHGSRCRELERLEPPG